MPAVRRASVSSIHTEDAEASEVLMINALVQTGEFLPLRWGVSVEDIECWEKVWRFCEEYQAMQGEAPGYGLLMQRFPDFPRMTEVGCQFAATELIRDARSRRLRTAMGKASQALRSGDVDEAEALLSDVRSIRTGGKPGRSVFDAPTFDEEGPRYETPFGSLNRAIGGIGDAELWYLGGLSGHGKTMVLCQYAAKLIEQGKRVDYLSLEVPSRTINKRVRRTMATPEELRLLDARTKEDTPDFDAIAEGVALQRNRITGELHTFDSSHGRVNPMTVRHHCAQADLVIVDHVGLMYTPDGRRAIDDWRLYATISNALLEEKLASGTTIMGAAQLNRTADSRAKSAPGLDSVGGAYQLVQDADVFITMRRRGQRAMAHAARKVREGLGPSWWSEFDVKHARFGEITHDRADELAAQYPFDDE